ncbi:hypothetical protein IJM86_03815 [bacterium]|nr:hypothetical protein [bacterium]
MGKGATISQYKYNTGTEYSSIPCIYYAENTAQNCFSPDEMVDILS